VSIETLTRDCLGTPSNLGCLETPELPHILNFLKFTLSMQVHLPFFYRKCANLSWLGISRFGQRPRRRQILIALRSPPTAVARARPAATLPASAAPPRVTHPPPYPVTIPHRPVPGALPGTTTAQSSNPPAPLPHPRTRSWPRPLPGDTHTHHHAPETGRSFGWIADSFGMNFGSTVPNHESPDTFRENSTLNTTQIRDTSGKVLPNSWADISEGMFV
jgi:hypothetical protein